MNKLSKQARQLIALVVAGVVLLLAVGGWVVSMVTPPGSQPNATPLVTQLPTDLPRATDEANPNPEAAPFVGASVTDANAVPTDSTTSFLDVPLTTDPAVMGGAWARAAYTYDTTAVPSMNQWFAQMQRFTYPSSDFSGFAERHTFKAFLDFETFKQAAVSRSEKFTTIEGISLSNMWPVTSAATIKFSAKVEQTWVDDQVVDYHLPTTILQNKAWNAGFTNLHVVTVKLLVTEQTPDAPGSTNWVSHQFETFWSSVIQCDPDSGLCAAFEAIEAVN